MKRLFILVLALCLSVLNPMTASAVSATSDAFVTTETESVDYMNYDFPEDAIILYQSEDCVVYQSKQKSTELNSAEIAEISPRAMEYESVWIDAGVRASGSFTIANPHTLWVDTKGTLGLHSNNPNAEVQIIVSGNAIPIFKTNIKPSDGEVLFETSNNAQKYEIWYTVMSTSSTDGMRINCWLY